VAGFGIIFAVGNSNNCLYASNVPTSQSQGGYDDWGYGGYIEYYFGTFSLSYLSLGIGFAVALYYLESDWNLHDLGDDSTKSGSGIGVDFCQQGIGEEADVPVPDES